MGIKMRRLQKRYIILLCLVIFLLILVSLGALYINRKTLFPHWYGPKKFTGNIFGKPNEKTDYEFPLSKPQFRAKISALKLPSLLQQSVTIYPIGSNKQNPVFQRNFYDDGFRGKILTYYFASDSATIRQSGSLGTIGCTRDCEMMWSNFYTLDTRQQAFILDNATHKDFFQQMLISYQAIDKRGCNIAGNNIVPNQADLTLTQLYTKHPTLSWYYSNSQWILSTNLLSFLKAENTVRQLLNGKNLSSNDI